MGYDTAPAVSDRSRVDPDAVIGLTLRRSRLRAGLTCDQAAAASGLSPTRIAAIEDGDGSLLLAEALPLARAYSQSLPELAHRFASDLSARQEAQQ
jgi:DNA-binding XRE family transcriptional regulator